MPSVVCITEKALGGIGTDEKVTISMIAVTPSTGDVIWDEFVDGFMRSELEVGLQSYFFNFRNYNAFISYRRVLSISNLARFYFPLKF